MKKAPIFKLGFTGYSDKNLPVTTNFILLNMTNNANYTDADSYLDAAKAKLKTFNDAKAARGTILNYKQVKAKAKGDLITALVDMGKYARDKYPGNVLIWNTTGYDIQTFDESTQKPPTPENISAKDGDTGVIIASYSKSRFATYYEGRHWKKSETKPTGMTAVSNTTKLSFVGCEPGVVYQFQIRSHGTKGNSDWSSTLSFVPRPAAE